MNSRLEKLRCILKFNPNAFAKALNIPQPTYVRYEKGERKLSAELFMQLKENFDVNINWLLTGEGEMFNTPPSLKLRKIPLELVFKNFGKKINKLQTENDLSLSDAAEFLDISEDDFVDYCLNRKKPDLDIVVKILNNFDVDFEYFLE